MIPSASSARSLLLEVHDRRREATRTRSGAMTLLRLARAARAEVRARRRLELLHAAVAARPAAAASSRAAASRALA